MSVLAEAISVVVANSAIKRRYRGGFEGFVRDCPGASFCSDGVLSRVGFLARRDADYFASMLTSAGLSGLERGAFVDLAIVDQNRGPLAPCLWIEFGHERDGTPVVWHAASRRGVAHVPQGWNAPAVTHPARFARRAFTHQVQYLRGKADRDWFRDRLSGKVFSVPRPFMLH